MKIAFVLGRIKYGGGERVILTLADAFKDNGHNIIFITHNPNLLKESLPGKCFFIGKTTDRIKSLLNTKIICEREKIDIVILFGQDPYVSLGTLFTKTKLLFSLRVDPNAVHSPLQWATKLTHFCANGIVFQTKKVQNYYGRYVRNKSIVIPNPILDELPPIEEHREKKIVGVGRLCEQKNFSLLIKAASIVDLKGYTIHIYGKGEQEETLKEQIDRLGLSKSVFLEGYVSNTLEAIKDAEIFVMSSNSEGMPNALIEAMCMKLACISTDVPSGGSCFLINNHENGILIPVNDSTKLAEGLQFLIDNKSHRESYAANAYTIRELLKKERIIKTWAQYLESIIAK